MRAVSVQDLLQRQQKSTRPTVEDAARDIMGRFSQSYGRKMVSLDEGVEAQGEVGELRDLIARAEEEAGRMNKEKGGWRTEPDGRS